MHAELAGGRMESLHVGAAAPHHSRERTAATDELGHGGRRGGATRCNGPGNDVDLKNLAASWLRHEWPTTIVRDRYGGVYSGGLWTAWALLPQDVPNDVLDEDVPCRRWWVRHRASAQLPVGVGATADEALEQLRGMIRRHAQTAPR